MTSTIDFYESDFSATLYPLKTNLTQASLTRDVRIYLSEGH